MCEQTPDRIRVLDGVVRRFELASVSGVPPHFWLGGQASE